MVSLRVNSKGRDFKEIAAQFMKQAQFVKVGILEDKTKRSEKTKETNASIARVQEYGYRAKGVPARPFLRPSFQKHRDEYIALFERILKASTANPSLLANSMQLIGQRAQADVRKYITAGPQIPPPNAPRYLAYKRALAKKGKASMDPRTLVLSSQMVKAINYAVVKGRSSPSNNKPIVNVGRYGRKP
jgi:hypothetical protein